MSSQAATVAFIAAQNKCETSRIEFARRTTVCTQAQAISLTTVCYITVRVGRHHGLQHYEISQNYRPQVSQAYISNTERMVMAGDVQSSPL